MIPFTPARRAQPRPDEAARAAAVLTQMFGYFDPSEASRIGAAGDDARPLAA